MLRQSNCALTQGALLNALASGPLSSLLLFSAEKRMRTRSEISQFASYPYSCKIGLFSSARSRCAGTPALFLEVMLTVMQAKGKVVACSPLHKVALSTCSPKGRIKSPEERHDGEWGVRSHKHDPTCGGCSKFLFSDLANFSQKNE